MIMWLASLCLSSWGQICVSILSFDSTFTVLFSEEQGPFLSLVCMNVSPLELDDTLIWNWWGILVGREFNHQSFQLEVSHPIVSRPYLRRHLRSWINKCGTLQKPSLSSVPRLAANAFQLCSGSLCMKKRNKMEEVREYSKILKTPGACTVYEWECSV